jgi:uncharacterized iron-regulated membrane protein
MSVWQFMAEAPREFLGAQGLFPHSPVGGHRTRSVCPVNECVWQRNCLPQPIGRAYPASLNSIEWLVDLHENLLLGSTGRSLNGIGSIFVTLLCLTGAIIWWPGIDHWRRSLTVNWRGHIGRINWDLHSALGLWFFSFVLMWGISGFYFCFSHVVNDLFGFLDPRNKFTSPTLYWLSAIHFGRFDWFTEVLWALLGLVPAILSATGVFLYSHRMIYKSVHRRTNPE